MRYLTVKVGLLSALITVCAAAAAEPQQDDQSYLPPASLRAAPGAAPIEQSQRAAIEPRRRHARAVRHHAPRIYREARYPRYPAPGFFFSFF